MIRETQSSWAMMMPPNKRNVRKERLVVVVVVVVVIVVTSHSISPGLSEVKVISSRQSNQLHTHVDTVELTLFETTTSALAFK